MDVSVVVPTYKGEAHIGACLRSLAVQRWDRDAYEVVVVQNGPPDGTAQVLAAVREEFPDLRLRSVVIAEAGASLARNTGLQAARGSYVTFVDDDDTVSPDYLRVLREHTDEVTVGLAQMANVPADGGAPTFHGGVNPAQLARPDLRVPPYLLASALSFTAAKMLSTELARAVGFDVGLRSGEDIVFWARALAAGRFAFGLCPPEEHAVYYRTMRADSVSRQELSYDFNVVQRLDVLERLEQVATGAKGSQLLRAITPLQTGQTDFANRFLVAHPDQHQTVVEEIRRRDLRSVPYHRLNRGLARDLAILYVALPYADTSAIVAARRIREHGTVVDVLSCDMHDLRGKDHEAAAIWQEYVDQTAEMKVRPTNAWWPGIAEYCRRGMTQIQAWEQAKGPYRSVYSRAMWPAAHVLAAWYKVRNPHTPWLAEFSDPLLHGIKGEIRRSSGQVDEALLDELRAAMVARGFTPPAGENMYEWIEALVYALADSVLFTNENQRDYMLGYHPDPKLVERARERAVVDHHPSLPPPFYERVPTSYPLDPTKVNIAYFGVFYATRGLTEVLDGLRMLTPEARAQVRLHVFTSKPEVLAEEAGRVGLGDVIIANPYVLYLEFLALTRRFDALLVNDAHTGPSHGINPYLPSKYSDYAGSGTPVWGVVEPGSVLSTRPLSYRSVLDDPAGAAKVLMDLIETKASAG